jgi:hypothetical protein
MTDQQDPRGEAAAWNDPAFDAWMKFASRVSRRHTVKYLAKLGEDPLAQILFGGSFAGDCIMQWLLRDVLPALAKHGIYDIPKDAWVLDYVREAIDLRSSIPSPRTRQ